MVNSLKCHTTAPILAQKSDSNNDSFAGIFCNRQCRQEELSAGQRGEACPPGLLSISQFRHVWRKLGLRVSREEALAIFHKFGCDKQGLLPYDVFAAKLLGSAARLLALEPQQKVRCMD